MKKYLTILIATLLASTVYAAGKPPGAGGGGGKPGGGEETAGNNLSVPAVFVAGSGVTAPALRIDCASSPQKPGWDGVAENYVYEDEYYWTQKSAATWSASCTTSQAGVLNVTADWGDNLTGDGRLSAGRPIRVEVGLVVNSLGFDAGTGWIITKLTPDLEDRLATYGTNGDMVLTSYRVFDPSSMLKIEKCAVTSETGCVSFVSPPIYEGPMTAEINSGGAIVYGFNWGTQGRTNAPSTGKYRIAYSVTGVGITAVADAKANYDIPTNQTYVYVTIGSKGGGSVRPR